MPANTPSLRAVLSYYSAVVTLNPEGDVNVNESLEGLGTRPHFFARILGPIWRIFSRTRRRPPDSEQDPESDLPAESKSTSTSTSTPSETKEAPSSSPPPLADAILVPGTPFVLYSDDELEWFPLPPQTAMWESRQYYVQVLTDLLPDPGYFVAGGTAGVVSRTATAPLDRLKVYLIAKVGTKGDALQAAKSGAPVQAAKRAAWPLVDAVKDLWGAGGVRSLFAGT